MRSRNHRIEFHLNDMEFGSFSRSVNKSGLTYSAYLRHLINGRQPQEKPPPEYFDVLKELRAIGRNVNQIAMVANVTGIIEADKYGERYKLLLDTILRLI